MRQHLLLAAFVLLGFHTAHAETVSIANMDVSREAIYWRQPSHGFSGTTDIPSKEPERKASSCCCMG